jgi:hypothetical protein
LFHFRPDNNKIPVAYSFLSTFDAQKLRTLQGSRVFFRSTKLAYIRIVDGVFLDIAGKCIVPRGFMLIPVL